MSPQDVEPVDFSCQIEAELNGLVTLAELIRERDDPAGLRDGFYLGLSEMIESSSDRIKKMLEPMYAYCHLGTCTRRQGNPLGYRAAGARASTPGGCFPGRKIP